MYRRIYNPEHHRSDRYGFVAEHVILAEESLGRKLRKGEIVHHKDWRKFNNSEDNLLFPMTRKEHQNIPMWQARFIITRGLYKEFMEFWNVNKNAAESNTDTLQRKLVETLNKRDRLENKINGRETKSIDT